MTDESNSGEKPTFRELRQRVQAKIANKKLRIQKHGGNLNKIPGGFLIEEAANDVRQEEERAGLEKLTTVDPLTGLLNLRGYERRQKEETERATRNKHPLVVASLDLNDLKTTNDTSGHQKGDEYLKTVAEIIKETTRLIDVAARVGGDEFRVLLTETDIDEAKVWLERLRKKFEEKGVNISVGLSTVDLKMNIMHSIELADQRMYQDKRTQKKENGK